MKLLSLLPLFCLLSSFPATYSNMLGLLAIKSQIFNDPNKILNSWNGTNTDFCKWYGVLCGKKHPKKVVSLDLRSQGLSGYLSPFIGNLTFLRTLILKNNSFSGDIPPEIGRLRRLRLLNLKDNLFHGRIPSNLSFCSDINRVVLENNLLSGKIPYELKYLSKLEVLNLHTNNLTGIIQPWLGNLSFLTWLALGRNNLGGGIPNEIGNLKALKYFQVGLSMLSGIIPPSFFNLSNLEEISMSFNELQGMLPSSMGDTLPNLRILYSATNKFEGHIPSSLFNASKLERVQISENNFSGLVPSSMGKLENFELLDLSMNSIHANNVEEWKFVDELTNCTHLFALSLHKNLFRGSIPNSLVNLSTQLEYLSVGSNSISGSVPLEIGNLVNLNVLNMNENLLYGNIPESIGKIKTLEHLNLDNNQLRGNIPVALSNLTLLYKLRLNDNRLDGSISPRLGDIKKLNVVDFSSNKLIGSIPKELLSSLYECHLLNFSYNSLTGSIPLEVGSLKNVLILSFSSNKLSGKIPRTLSNCLSLQHLSLDGNSFEGEIPSSLSNIKGLLELDLSNNSLSGIIPKELEQIHDLVYLNLSSNHLHGKVPSKGVFANISSHSLLGNVGLCGGSPKLRLPVCTVNESRSEKKFIIFMVVIPIIVFVFALSVVLLVFLFVRKSRKQKLPNSSFDEGYPKVSYAQLARGTNRFSSTSIIGCGRHGTIYKGSIEHVEGIVAVKVFNLEVVGASRSFMAECKALRNIRHRNIVKILVSCSSIDLDRNEFKALVFRYMPNGSLEEWLHPEYERRLSFDQRVDIAIDIAEALDYLHNDCQPLVIHCDVKPSNILLDDDMLARLADFGLASALGGDGLLDPDQSDAMIGTIGYIAPEFGLRRANSTAGDVYSYGILLLELFTGRRPVNDLFVDGFTLHDFSTREFPSGISNIVDPSLLNCVQEPESRISEECLVSIIGVGISCSNHLPENRMEMRDAVSELHKIKSTYNKKFDSMHRCNG